jgi:protein TonB
MISQFTRAVARGAAICACLAACSAEPPPAAPAPTATAVVPAPTPAAPGSIPKAGALPGDIARLIAIANEDFAASRFVSPPTANALEGFLEVRDLDPDNASVREAMGDLYPVATAAVSAALAQRDLGEAERILALVERAMPDALGVADLRKEVDALKAGETARNPGAGDAPAQGDVAVGDPAAPPVVPAGEGAPPADQGSPTGSEPAAPQTGGLPP